MVGLLGSLWGGLGVTQAMQGGVRPDLGGARSRTAATSCVRGCAGLGVPVHARRTLFLIASIASGLVIGGLGGTLVKVAGIAFSLVLNFALFFLSFRLLTVDHIPTRQL